jgi:hypothetical protein
VSYDGDDLIRVPSKSMFTDISGGVATTADVEGGISITASATGGYNIKGMDMAVPSAPYTLTTKLDFNGSVPHASICGYGIHVSDGTKLEAFHIAPSGTIAGTFDILVFDMTDLTHGSVAYGLLVPWFFGGIFIRLNDNNTSRTWSVSKDGVNFTAVYAVTRTAFLTPTRIGFSVNAWNSAPYATLTHWRVT